MTHWLLVSAKAHLQSMDKDRRRSFLRSRLTDGDWTPVGHSSVDVTGEEPEDVLSAALSREMDTQAPEVHRDASDVAEAAMRELLDKAYIQPDDTTVLFGERLIHALGAAKSVSFKPKIRALFELLGRDVQGVGANLSMACIRSLVSMPKEISEAPFWEELAKRESTKALANRVLKEISVFGAVSTRRPDWALDLGDTRSSFEGAAKRRAIYHVLNLINHRDNGILELKLLKGFGDRQEMRWKEWFEERDSSAVYLKSKLGHLYPALSALSQGASATEAPPTRTEGLLAFTGFYLWRGRSEDLDSAFDSPSRSGRQYRSSRSTVPAYLKFSENA